MGTGIVLSMPRIPLLLSAAIAWVITRAAMVWFSLAQHEQWGDVKYYLDGLHLESAGQRALGEYPDATVIPLRFIGWFTDDLEAFTTGVIVFCLLMDAALSWWLACQPRWQGFIFWILFGMFIGPVMIARLDLLPGVLVAGAAVWIGRSPRVAAVLLGLATAVKLWPLALATGLVGSWRSRCTWTRLAWWAATVAAITLLTTITSGWWRVLSPLQYQTDRGLQSETLFATPFIWLAAFNENWDIEYSASKSFEVLGTGVGFALIVSTVATAGVAAFGLVVTARRFFITGGQDPVATRAYWLALVLLIVVTAKVFSPQYLLWFGPLIAVMIALDGGASRHLRVIGWLMVIAAGFTSWFFPLLFDYFIEDTPSLLSVAVLTARNILMLAVTVLACRWAVVALATEKNPGNDPAARHSSAHNADR